VELSFLLVKDKIVAVAGLIPASSSTQVLLLQVYPTVSVVIPLVQPWLAMDKTEKEEIAVTLVQEEEMIAIAEEVQQVQLLLLFYLLSLAKKHSIPHSYKHGLSLLPTVAISQAHTQLTAV
jgi:hypothetical protein